MIMEKLIREKAEELGYEKCGIVKIEDLRGYDERLQERVDKEPAAGKFYERQRRLTRLTEQYPWAKSVIVAVSCYGQYKVPEQLAGRIGKHYLFDGRVNTESREYQRSAEMVGFLKELGLNTAFERNFGAVGLRWAAMMAGLGIVRRNNFFYTESGSLVELEAWITDGEMESVESADLPPCPEGCDRCIKACPTGSLSSPYTMNPMNCVSMLTTFGGRDLPNNPLAECFGNWIYGCDACQDACPMNRGKRTEKEEFPGVSELAPRLTPESILTMEEEYYKRHIQPKFFYLTPDELWKWKVNALNYMRNQYDKSYMPYITEACKDDNEKIRDMANMIMSEMTSKDFCPAAENGN